MQTQTITFGVRMAPDLAERSKALAHQLGYRGRGTLIAELLEEFVREHDPQADPQVRPQQLNTAEET